MSDEETKTDDQGEGTTMAEKLTDAGKKAEKAAKVRRERTVQGSHLLEAMMHAARATGLEIVERTDFAIVQGASRKRVCVAKKGGRVDLSGFSVEHEAVLQLTEQEAKDKHLGRVRGQLDFSKPDDSVMEAFRQALVSVAVEEKKDDAKTTAEEAGPTGSAE